MVPGVAFNREAADGIAHELDLPEQQFLDDQDPREHDKRVRRRCGMWGSYFTNAFINDAERSHH